jgi:hypothetical protein
MNDKFVEELEFTLNAYKACKNKEEFYARLKSLFLEGMISVDVFNVFKKIFKDKEEVVKNKKKIKHTASNGSGGCYDGRC